MTSIDVLFNEEMGEDGSLGIITLNRPKSLNALNHAMIMALTQQLQLWAHQPDIKGVFIHATAGKAFCAGGDIRLTYDRMKSHDPQNVVFFREEYQLNRLIFHYPKPYIAFLDGITMGGGVGISIHGSHRIGTEHLLFAMPETAIGFFPDVGGTYFLPRLKGYLGIYLGLTGARLSSEDCLFLNIATHLVESKQKSALISYLINHSFGKDAKKTVSQLIHAFSFSEKHSFLSEAQKSLDECFKEDSIEKILDRLKSSAHSVCREAYTALLNKSPTSLKVSLQAMLNGKQLDFDTCMQQEFRLVNRFLTENDFAEGIRALIIDKDQSPQWRPKTLAEVDKNKVEAYFAPLKEELSYIS